MENTIGNRTAECAGGGIHAVKQTDTDSEIIPSVKGTDIKACIGIESRLKKANHSQRPIRMASDRVKGMGDSKDPPTKHNKRHPHLN